MRHLRPLDWACVVLGAVIGFGIGLLVFDDPPGESFPCAEHEVAVWTNYPNDWGCFADTDHEHHQGH